MKAALAAASSSSVEVSPALTSVSNFAIVGQLTSGLGPVARNCGTRMRVTGAAVTTASKTAPTSWPCKAQALSRAHYWPKRSKPSCTARMWRVIKVGRSMLWSITPSSTSALRCSP